MTITTLLISFGAGCVVGCIICYIQHIIEKARKKKQFKNRNVCDLTPEELNRYREN